MMSLGDGGTGVGVEAIGLGSEPTGPSDVAMGIWVKRILGLSEEPAGAGVMLTQGEEVGGDVLLGTREPFLTDGELVHEEEAEIVLFTGEIDAGEGTGEPA